MMLSLCKPGGTDELLYAGTLNSNVDALEGLCVKFPTNWSSISNLTCVLVTVGVSIWFARMKYAYIAEPMRTFSSYLVDCVPKNESYLPSKWICIIRGSASPTKCVASCHVSLKARLRSGFAWQVPHPLPCFHPPAGM